MCVSVLYIYLSGLEIYQRDRFADSESWYKKI
jgi:hypothetical protein